MTQLAKNELWSVFDARRVKQPELRGLDIVVNGVRGWVTNRVPVLKQLKLQAERIEALEPEIHQLGATQFREEVAVCRDAARINKLEGDLFDRAVALAREGCWRAIGKRPYPVQIMGALAMHRDAIAEMAT